MDAKRREYVSIFIITVLIFLISGCANYGKLRLESRAVYSARAMYGEEMTIEKLVNNWRDYDIYYAGYKPSRASGVMFDPKNDDRRLLGDWWEKIEDKENLEYVLKWIDWSPFEPHSYGLNLYKMIGPDENLYGYMFTPTHHVVFKSVDEKSMYVYYLDNMLNPGLWPQE